MVANAESQALLRSYAVTVLDSELVELQNAIELRLQRAGLMIVITLPNDVPEWFVDVEDFGTSLKFHDWYDYAGYERSTVEQTDRDIAADLRLLVRHMLENPLRVRAVRQRGTKAVLESQVNGAWKHIVSRIQGESGPDEHGDHD